MKRFKTFWILFLSQVFLLLVNLILQYVIINQSFSNFYFEEKEKSLLKEAYIIENQISNLMVLGNFKNLQNWVSNLGKKTSSRLTVVLPNGSVIADSQSPLNRMDNHKERPEIKTALEGKVGKTIRFSDTLNQERIYLAIPIESTKGLMGVLRLSESTGNLKSLLRGTFSKFFLGSSLIILGLILIIWFYSKSLSLSLEKISSITENFSNKGFSEKMKAGPWDSYEISSLVRSLNKMSDLTTDQINKILKQKKEQEAVFSSMLEGVLTINIDRKIYKINHSAKKIFHLDQEKDYRGIPLKEAIRTKKIEDFYEEIILTKGFLDKEIVLENDQIFQVHGSIIQGEGDNISGVLLVFNDISGLRKLENHRKDFVANVSHELKTPLTTISGYLENLIDGSVESPDDQLKFLKIVQKQSLRLEKIIEDLLILSQVELDTNALLSGEVLDIGQILSSVKSLFSEKTENIIIDCEKNLKARVNSHLLEIAIGNLLGNAVRYGKKNGPIILAAKSVNGEIEISVKDEGIGISQEHHHRLFERFYSVDKSRSREFGGSGLGLSIVKHIAMAHNGHVSVESSPGKGSTFSIFIPKA
jgi:two-component system, OmpR family, phosphate regulon sensor histidine kinase PhoR